MEFEVNPQRQTYLTTRGKIVLNACPGSGKTTSIVKKLIDLQDEYNEYSGVACLSFTNAAKDEINGKFVALNGKALRVPHEVSTIDSFVNRYITLPFYYLLKNSSKRPRILDDNSFFDDLWRSKTNYKGTDGKPFCFAYPPSSIRFEDDGTYSSNGFRPDARKVDPNVFNDYCKRIKQWQINSGLITTGDSAFLARYLLNKHPRIGELLALRFPHIIIDEAQDSSKLQHDIFDKLVECGLQNLELVGDPYQSLYEWRDANPALFISKHSDSTNWQGLDLTNNRRSPQRIVDCFSLVRKAADPKIDSTVTNDRQIPITVYKYTETNTPLIVRHFDQLCKTHGLVNNQIVVRGNDLKDKMLGKTAEQKPWGSEIPYELIQAKHLYLQNEIKDAIKILRKLAIHILCPNFDYHQFRDAEQGLKSDHNSNSLFLEILSDMPNLSLSIIEWTSQMQIFLTEKLETTDTINFGLRNRNSKFFNKTCLPDPVETHFKKSSSNENIPITTVHQVKGKSLDGTLVFFNRNNHKDTITFDAVANNYEGVPSEKHRIIYVALSRSQHLLAMAFPQEISDHGIRSKFGNDVLIVSEADLNTIN
jgi:hypothetical protein